MMPFQYWQDGKPIGGGRVEISNAEIAPELWDHTYCTMQSSTFTVLGPSGLHKL